jgi:hypothetical protein
MIGKTGFNINGLIPDDFIIAVGKKPDDGGCFGLVELIMIKLNAIVNFIYDIRGNLAENQWCRLA